MANSTWLPKLKTLPGLASCLRGRPPSCKGPSDHAHIRGRSCPWPYPTGGQRGARTLCHWLPPLPTSLQPGMIMAVATDSSGLSPSLGGTGNLQAQTGNEAFDSAFFPCEPRATERAQPGLKHREVKQAGTNGGQAETPRGQLGGLPHYLYAAQLLRQDAEKVLGEVAQQGWVPVPIAPLAGGGSRAQHIDAAE